MRVMALVPWTLAALGGLPALAQAPAPAGADSDLQDLLELLNTPVVSASKSSEKLSEAPATVIVLKRSDLEDRGYTELSQILDDLPGMDMARSYGANYFKAYWRGYRSDIGDPFLVMVDGVPFNHLWYNTADTPLVTYPLSAIDRVEIVYGPASSVYGANAFMGVFNIITRKTRIDDGTSIRGKATGGSFGARIADAQVIHRSGDLTFMLAVRKDQGGMDLAAAERYEYTKAQYYRDPHIWGSILGDGGKAGRPESEHQHSAVDFRITYGNTEFAFQQLTISSGYGNAYAGDQSQSLGRWERPEVSFYVRHTEQVGTRLSSSTLVRYRRSDLANNSYDVESNFAQTGVPEPPGWWLYSYQSLSSSLSVLQDFEFKPASSFTLNAGLKYESKTLQKAYAYGSDYTREDPPRGSLSDANHFGMEERGLYAQARWRVAEGHQINLGLRSDHNSIYKSATTIRGGYVGTFGAWGLKALYGQAYQEPTGRQLYGAASGTGSNPDLKPERSHTAEVSGTYTDRTFSLSLGLYQIKNSGKIQKINNVVVNSGEQDITGADLGVQWLVPAPFVRQWKVWGYVSRYFKADDVTFTPGGSITTRSGDLADTKVYFGTTVLFDHHFSATVAGRFVGARPTVLSNPVREVDSYSTLDLAITGKDLFVRGLGASLRVANALDKAGFHPGLRDAGAGITPGVWNAGAGTYSGSQSYYSSLLPQPGRSVQVSVSFSF